MNKIVCGITKNAIG